LIEVNDPSLDHSPVSLICWEFACLFSGGPWGAWAQLAYCSWSSDAML